MKTGEVIDKLRKMKTVYAQQNIGRDPAALPDHLTDFEAYTGILYSHYAEFMEQYRDAEATILASENDERDEINAGTSKRELKRTVDEKNDRIAIRIAKMKGTREKLEAELKGATLHINTIQSKLKRQADEAKGMM